MRGHRQHGGPDASSLVLALNKSDVIVYIETGRVLPSTIVGRLLLAAGPEGTRYLRIQVSGHPGSNDMIALIGHELRHALEVAESPDVRDEASLGKDAVLQCSRDWRSPAAAW